MTRNAAIRKGSGLFLEFETREFGLEGRVPDCAFQVDVFRDEQGEGAGPVRGPGRFFHERFVEFGVFLFLGRTELFGRQFVDLFVQFRIVRLREILVVRGLDAFAVEQDPEEIGFKVELKILNADNYFTVIGNTSTPNLDTGFADWFQDYPHPNDFLFLLNGENIQSTNNQVFGQTNIPALNKKVDKLATEQLGPQQETEYSELDEEFMKEAAWAPYGTRTLSLFVSENINLESAIWNPTFETELTSLEFTE